MFFKIKMVSTTTFIIIALIFVILYLINKTNKRCSLNIDYYTPSDLTPDLELLKKERELRSFPYRFFQNQNGDIIPIVAITGFFRAEADKERYYRFVKGNIKVIGITAYRSFPVKIRDSAEDKFHLTDDFDYLKNIKVWLYCMREPEKYGFSADSHYLLNMSESDFYDADNNENVKVEKKKYDFIYICNKDVGMETCPLLGWNALVRNYSLALRCFPIMFNELNLKGLVVGRAGCGLEELYGDKIETTEFLPYHELQDKMKECKFLFAPNLLDASPRILAECLIKNIPVLMNQNILCGFKYINDETGVFFTSELDVKDAILNLYSKIDKINPKLWWTENHSRKKNASRLCNFLKPIYPEILEDVSEVSLFIN